MPLREGHPAPSDQKMGADRGPVDLHLEVKVQPGTRPGRALDTDPLPDPDAGSRDDLGINTGEVSLAGDNTVPVTQGNDISVIPVPMSAD
jgi:hypothetical protein